MGLRGADLPGAGRSPRQNDVEAHPDASDQQGDRRDGRHEGGDQLDFFFPQLLEVVRGAQVLTPGKSERRVGEL